MTFRLVYWTNPSHITREIRIPLDRGGRIRKGEKVMKRKRIGKREMVNERKRKGKTTGKGREERV